jgi:hypothetical protein
MLKFTLLLLFLQLVYSQNLLHPYSIQIEDSETECFYLEAIESHSLSLMFEVSAGDDLNIRAVIKGPPDHTNEVYNHVSQEDFLSFSAQNTGEYQFCFENIVSAGAKIVSFNIVYDTPPEPHLDAQGNFVDATFNATKDPGAARLMRSIVTIQTKLNNATLLVDQQGLHGTRQIWGARALLARVEWWASVKGATIILWTLGNVLAIRWMLSNSGQASHAMLSSQRSRSKVGI